MKLFTFLASRYVAGDTWHDALRAIRSMNERGLLATADFLGENVLNRSKAERAAKTYLHLLDAIDYHHLKANISVKLSQLGLDIDADFCAHNLEQILKKAGQYGNFVWLDMESSAYTDRTIEMYKKFVQKYGGNLGICIQSSLRRSESDLKNLLPLRPSIRLVKGAYKENSRLAFPLKKEVDANYRKLAEMILEAKPGLLAIATHDEKIVNEVLGWIKEGKANPALIEFEMLYGIRRDLQKKLVRAGYMVRIYTPFGRRWLPYFYRRLRERKENLLFALKSLFHR